MYTVALLLLSVYRAFEERWCEAVSIHSPVSVSSCSRAAATALQICSPRTDLGKVRASGLRYRCDIHEQGSVTKSNSTNLEDDDDEKGDELLQHHRCCLLPLVVLLLLLLLLPHDSMCPNRYGVAQNSLKLYLLFAPPSMIKKIGGAVGKGCLVNRSRPGNRVQKKHHR